MGSKRQSPLQSADVSPLASPTASLFGRKHSANSVGKSQRADKEGFTLKMQAITSKLSVIDENDKSNDKQHQGSKKQIVAEQGKEDKPAVSSKVVYQGE